MAERPNTFRPTVVNRTATRDHTVLERIEAGIELRGTEVKSIRDGRITLTGGYARADGRQMFLFDVHISPYEHGNRFNHDPTRPRLLLLRGREIASIAGKVEQKGLTILPLKVYFKRRWVKVELGLCKGKNLVDKRESLRRKTVDRETNRSLAAASMRRG